MRAFPGFSRTVVFSLLIRGFFCYISPMGMSIEDRKSALKASLADKSRAAHTQFSELRKREERLPEAPISRNAALAGMMERISINMQGIVHGPADESLVSNGLPHSLRKNQPALS
jgi:hypothetical protein